MTGYEQTAYGDLALIRRAVQSIAASTESIAGSLKAIADAAPAEREATDNVAAVIGRHMESLVEVTRHAGTRGGR